VPSDHRQPAGLVQPASAVIEWLATEQLSFRIGSGCCTDMTIETWIKIWRAGFLISFLGATQFVILCVVAMILYPGGTMLDENSVGYDLSENYLSDLGREVALDRQANAASRIFNGSLIALGICSLPFFFFMPTHAWDRTGGLTVAAVTGSLAAICLIVMGSNPCDVAPIPHFVALFFWIVAVFFAASIHALCLLTSKEGISVALSLVSVAVAMLAVAYIYHGTETAAAVLYRREIPLKSVLLQKLLMIATLIWMFANSAKLLLTSDFSEFYPRDVSKETDDYLQELGAEPWVPQRK
jgi:hypothetical membrane protein